MSKHASALSRHTRWLQSPSLLMLLASVILISLLCINEVAFRGAKHASQQGFEEQDRRTAVGELMQAIFQAEASLRGYMLTSEPMQAQQYQEARTRILHYLEKASAPTVHSKQDEALYQQLGSEVKAHLSEMDLLLNLHSDNKSEAFQLALSSNRSVHPLETLQTLDERIQQYKLSQISETQRKIMFFLRLSQMGVALMSLAALLVFYLYLSKVKHERQQKEKNMLELEQEQLRLEKLVRKRTASISELANHLQTVRDNERANLARELHDELGSLLTVAKLDAAQLKAAIGPDKTNEHERLDHLSDILGQIVVLKRRIIENLHPSTLGTLGLVAALKILADQFSASIQTPVELELEEFELPKNVQLAIYRVTQEALTNIGKYAQASRIQVFLRQKGDHAQLVIQDDGQGFEMQEGQTATHGLRGMRHRIESLGGKLDIKTAIGGGCIITALVPLDLAVLPWQDTAL